VASDFAAWRNAHGALPPPQNRWDRGRRGPEELSRPRFREVLEHQRKLRREDRFYSLAVFERTSGALVGGASLMDVMRGLAQAAFLGWFVHSPFWRRGYGKEAVRALIDIGFRDVGLHRLEAGIEPENRRSILLARSLGLRKEGLKRRAVFLRDTWVDLGVYAVTCEDVGIPWKGMAKPSPR
jgi:ribosomal-protein-alanine N-acetyltransferase